MTTLTPPTVRIAEVSQRTGLTGHTLRFYDRERLFADPVQRDDAGHRVFTEDQIQWLLVCSKLRSSGMSLPDIRRYAQLLSGGGETIEERYEILRNHEHKVRDQLAELQDALAIIKTKVAFYAQRMADGTADDLWRDGPQCQATPQAWSAPVFPDV